VKQTLRHETVQAAIDGRMTNAEAAAALRLSVRHLQRLKCRVRTEGPLGVLHGNTGREPPSKTPPKVRDKAIELATPRYAQLNFSYLADTLAENHDIVLSDETLRLWLRPMGHGEPVRRAKTPRRRRKRRRPSASRPTMGTSFRRRCSEAIPLPLQVVYSGVPPSGRPPAPLDREPAHALGVPQITMVARDSRNRQRDPMWERTRSGFSVNLDYAWR